MNAIREFIKVKNHKVEINLPKNFNYDEVEVIIMPKDEYEYWNEEESKNVGKMGFISSSFEEDNEDYSKW